MQTYSCYPGRGRGQRGIVSAERIQRSREELAKTIDLLFKTARDSDAKERCKITDRVINRYIERTGETPPPNLLDRLAGFILKADKSKKNRYDSDYKVLSHRQIKTRKAREISINYVNNKDKIKHNIQITRDGAEKFCSDY